MSTYVATLNDAVIARSDQTVPLEGNRYFPPNSIREEHFTRTKNQVAFRDAISVTEE